MRLGLVMGSVWWGGLLSLEGGRREENGWRRRAAKHPLSSSMLSTGGLLHPFYSFSMFSRRWGLFLGIRQACKTRAGSQVGRNLPRGSKVVLDIINNPAKSEYEYRYELSHCAVFFRISHKHGLHYPYVVALSTLSFPFSPLLLDRI